MEDEFYTTTEIDDGPFFELIEDAATEILNKLQKQNETE